MAGRKPDEGQRGKGGYSAVAAALNHELDWPDGKVITRQQIAAWASRHTPNKASQLPPSPVVEDPGAVRSKPTRIYRIADWVTWASAGVPGPRGAKEPGSWGSGYVIPVPAQAGARS